MSDIGVELLALCTSFKTHRRDTAFTASHSAGLCSAQPHPTHGGPIILNEDKMKSDVSAVAQLLNSYRRRPTRPKPPSTMAPIQTRACKADNEGLRHRT